MPALQDKPIDRKLQRINSQVQAPLMIDVNHHCGIVHPYQNMVAAQAWEESFQGNAAESENNIELQSVAPSNYPH